MTRTAVASPPATDRFEISCEFSGHGWAEFDLHIDEGVIRIEGVSYVGSTFGDFAASALTIATGRYKATEIRAEHEPNETVISVTPEYLSPRNAAGESWVLRIAVVHPISGAIGSFSVSPDRYVNAVWSFLAGIRDGMGIDAYYKAYGLEPFPTKALAALEAAMRTPADYQPPH